MLSHDSVSTANRNQLNFDNSKYKKSDPATKKSTEKTTWVPKQQSIGAVGANLTDLADLRKPVSDKGVLREKVKRSGSREEVFKAKQLHAFLKKYSQTFKSTEIKQYVERFEAQIDLLWKQSPTHFYHFAVSAQNKTGF